MAHDRNDPRRRASSAQLGVPVQRAPSEPMTRRTPRPPARTNPARAYAVLVGLLVGLAAVGVVAAAQQLTPADEQVSGRSQLATLAGMLVLVGVGVGLLALCRVRYPVRTGVLGVGLITVVVMLFTVDRPPSLLLGGVLVLLSAGAFALARRVTTTYVVR